MRTRRTTALSNEEPEVDATTQPTAKRVTEGESNAGREVSAYPSDAAATAEVKTTKATKRRKRNAEVPTGLDTVDPAGRKRHKPKTAEQQEVEAQEPAGSRKQKGDRAGPQGGQRVPEVPAHEASSAADSHQTSSQQTAKSGGKLAAVRDNAMETPEDDDAPEEVETAV